MARDESRDVWLMRFGLNQALDAEEPRTVRLLPESNKEYNRIGYTRYVPHDQFEAEHERGISECRAWVAEAEEKLFRAVVRDQELEAAQKRIAELEAELKEANTRLATVSPQAVQELALAARMMATPRCKDGCEHWLGRHCDGTGPIAVASDGSSWCCHHSRLKK